MAKQGPLEIVEGFYLAQIVYHLHRHQIFDRLATRSTAAEIVRDFGGDEELLAVLFDFVYRTSDILLRDRSYNYQVNPKYQFYAHFGFHLDKFLGAYGPVFTRLEEVLSSATLGKAFVDNDMLAQAFARVERSGTSIIADLIRERNVRSLLDLGCGPATLLIELGLADWTFQGWGVDANPAMCAVAKERIIQAGLANRVQVLHTDVRQLENHLQPDLRCEIGALHGRSLLNEFFRHGTVQAVAFIAQLKNLFPDRLLFVVDYYGKLAQVPTRHPQYRHTYLHDLAQSISAQGVPPPDLQTWAAVYEAAGCTIVHAYEGENNGIEWFIHVVQL